MLGRKVYLDLETEINILKYRIKDLREEYVWWHKQIMNMDKKPAAGLDKCVMRMNKIVDDIAEYEYLLRNKEQMKKQIEKELAKYKGIDGKVMYMHIVEGKTLQEIADEIGYSLSWVKKRHMRLSRGA